MDFWATFWATMWGALAGAVVGSIGTWLVSLDLRRRGSEDRQQTREQDRLDREAERAQARADRRAELADEREYRRVEREEQRQELYEDEIMRAWPRVADELMEYANANRVVRDALVTRQRIDGDRYRRSVVSLMGCLHEVATFARGSDHEIVNNLGVMAAVLPPHERETVEAIDSIRIQLSSYITARPEYRADRKERLRTKLVETTGVRPEQLG